MRTGFKPRILGQIFAPVPASQSRSLSAFVAIARHNLPLPLRFGMRDVIGYAGLSLIPVGLAVSWITDTGSKIVPFGIAAICLTLLASVVQDRLTYGNVRAHLIRQLDETRRNVGLDRAILPESLEFLEGAAQQWERIEHALQSQLWREQDVLRSRIYSAAHRAMEEILVLECGNVNEAGMTDDDAERRLTDMAQILCQLATQLDAASTELLAYPREGFDSNGLNPPAPLPQIELLEENLKRIEQLTPKAY